LLKEERGSVRYDFILLALTLLLTLLGLVILYSASYLFAANQAGRFKDGWAPLSSNFTVCIIMIVLFPVIALINLDCLKKTWVVILLVAITIALNLLPFVERFRLSPDNASAMRWVNLGFASFQPSELIKVVLPFYLAYILDKNNDKLDKFGYGPLPPFIVTCLFCFLVFRQSNLSDTIIIALLSLVICFVAGIRLRWFVLAFALIVPLGYQFVYGDKTSRWYQRIESFFSPEAPPEGLKRQIDFSMEAIQSGGFWGKGIGQGSLKTRIPEVHGDFVFASFAEESGFLGVLLYFALFGVFSFICYKAALRGNSRFAQLFAFGLVTWIVIQTLVNIAVVAKVVPTTGVPLPFVSSGGSSLLSTLVSAALLVNITRRGILGAGGQDAG
jgi:cell division protein FtsW